MPATVDYPQLALGSSVPIDIAPLATVPNLHGLDLSSADVLDSSVLARMNDLRYLALTAQQWSTLLDGPGGVPSTLAAAQLLERDATLDDALAWASRLGIDTSDAVRITGTIGRTVPV